MQFLNADFFNNYISQSYDNIVQQYYSGSYLYFLDAHGNVIAFIITSSVGTELITTDLTSSLSFDSASYSLSSSYSVHSSFSDLSSTSSYSNKSIEALSADFAALSGISVTSSYSRNSDSASYISKSVNTTFPLQGGGDINNNPNITIPQANSSQDGYVSQADWNIFNNKASTNFAIAMAIAL